ncbi:MAG: aldo/keto reductase [Pseudomarimonas sp.]
MIQMLAAAALTAGLRGVRAAPAGEGTPRLPAALPKVGLGTWITFNIGRDDVLQRECNEVVRQFFARGGRLIDSSPMYGSSQAVVGRALQAVDRVDDVFAADKIWAAGTQTEAQAERTRALWGVATLDLLQVHNLEDWEHHLPNLTRMKASGRIRHVGITTSEGRRHGTFEQIMRTHPLDCVQFSYNIVDREAEQRLLPLAAERGIAVICNRPFRQGDLFRSLRGKHLPPWAAELGCSSWAAFMLKFVISHPGVSCAIPATSRVDHLQQNMDAMRGPMPDAAMRRRMASHFAAL